MVSQQRQESLGDGECSPHVMTLQAAESQERMSVDPVQSVQILSGMGGILAQGIIWSFSLHEVKPNDTEKRKYYCHITTKATQYLFDITDIQALVT